MHITWYTSASLDGRIAGPDDDMALLDTIDVGSSTTAKVGSAGERDADDFNRFEDSVGALLVGADTLRWLHGQGHDLPLRGKPVWLLSHDRALADRAASADPAHTPVMRREGDVGAVLDEIAARGCEHLWVCGGGSVAGQVLALDRIDTIILTIAPVALGAGPGIFDLPAGVRIPPARFTLAECREFGAGSVRLRWERSEHAAHNTHQD